MPVLAFIGCGNMGGALARAAAKQPGNRLLLANRSPEKAETLAAELGGEAVSNAAAAQRGDYIFLGVKPHLMAGLLAELRSVLAARTSPFVLVSMAAALSIETLQTMAGGAYPLLRIMPNTPVAVGEGMTLYCPSPELAEETTAEFLRLMSAAGRFVRLEERLIDAGGSVAGCGPAFVDLFVEALADGGVLCGLPRAKALELAAQMCLGAAKLILDSGKHPGELKDAVCSPGGTTIEGVRALEEGGFRAAVMNAVIAAFEKNKKL